MDDNSIVAVKHEESKPLTPLAPVEDALALAAVCVENGDVTGAAGHLHHHLKTHPEQIMIRAYLAEILLQTKQYPDAQYHFERFIAEAQESDGSTRKHVLHCHTRLMEIAQARNDGYAEHLNRGIGLVLLARQLDTDLAAAETEQGFRERLLCKASRELRQAEKLRPDEPRPSLYLFEVWTKLDQPRSAERALKKAKAYAALLPLPPAEYRLMQLAQ